MCELYLCLVLPDKSEGINLKYSIAGLWSIGPFSLLDIINRKILVGWSLVDFCGRLCTFGLEALWSRASSKLLMFANNGYKGTASMVGHMGQNNIPYFIRVLNRI